MRSDNFDGKYTDLFFQTYQLPLNQIGEIEYSLRISKQN